MTMKRCSHCGITKSASEFNTDKHNRDILQSWCRSCSNKANNERRYRIGECLPLGTNSACACFLGVYVAERVLSHVFKNIERMPFGNPGFDFVCGRGYKIDVKSAARAKSRPNTWMFTIKKNITADFFLCLAFDNRTNLNPEHVWLVPGNIINNRKMTSISDSTLAKWEAYRLSDKLDEVTSCCDILKGTA